MPINETPEYRRAKRINRGNAILGVLIIISLACSLVTLNLIINP
jgi:hypothetical protein